MIKKRLLPILMLLIFAMAFAGCDREAVSLGIELKSVNSWKATETQGTMVYAITHNNQTISVTMDYDKYSEMATQTAEIMVNIKSISVLGKSVDFSTLPNLSKSFKVYQDSKGIYISSSVLKEIFSSDDEVLKNSDLMQIYTQSGIDLTKDYVLFEQAPIVSTIDTVDYVEKLNPGIPVTCNSSKYSFKVSDKQMVGMFTRSIEQIAGQGTVKETVKQGFLKGIEGSSIAATFDFDTKNGKYKLNYDVTYAQRNEEIPVVTHIVNDSTITKVGRRDVIMPTSYSVYAEDANNQQTTEPAEAPKTKKTREVTVSKQYTFIKDGRTYVAAKQLCKSAHVGFRYDAATKTFFINGVKIPGKIFIKDGVGYIRLVDVHNATNLHVTVK